MRNTIIALTWVILFILFGLYIDNKVENFCIDYTKDVQETYEVIHDENWDADLLFVNKIYYNYELNFKFLIPNNLVGKISINENTDQNTSSSYKIFNFYYNESSTPYLDKKNRQQLFSLNLAEKGVVDDSKTINNKGDIILESDKYVYSISDINEKLFNKLGLSIDILKDYFSIIK